MTPTVQVCFKVSGLLISMTNGGGRGWGEVDCILLPPLIGRLDFSDKGATARGRVNDVHKNNSLTLENRQ